MKMFLYLNIVIQTHLHVTVFICYNVKMCLYFHVKA